MDNFTTGIVITVVGIVVTLLTLYILMLVINILNKMFPYKQENEKKQ